MCIVLAPAALAWASLAVSAAGTAATLAAQHQQAIGQQRYQASLTTASNNSAYAQMSQLRIQQAESTESTAREQEKARLTTQRAISTATVAAGEAGVSGNSVGALLGEYGMQFGQFKEASNRQATLTNEGISDQIEAVRLGGDAQNLNINRPIAGPNYAGAALNLAGSALGTYRDYNPNAFKKAV